MLYWPLPGTSNLNLRPKKGNLRPGENLKVWTHYLKQNQHITNPYLALFLKLSRKAIIKYLFVIGLVGENETTYI